MAGPLQHVVNATASEIMATYYERAAHRRLALPASLSPVRVNDNILLWRGKLHFEPAEVYLENLRAQGHAGGVFRFVPPSIEHNLLTTWHEEAEVTFQTLTERPELLGKNPVLVGHSAGGHTVYLLAALAKGNPERVQWALPGLTGIPPAALRRLANELRGALFITIATPHNGIRFTRSGRILNGLIAEPRVPGFFSQMTRRELERLYDRVGKRPSEVIDGNIYSDISITWSEGDLPSMLANAFVHAGMHVFSPFVRHAPPHDGIVPRDAAFLQGLADDRQINAKIDHLKMVETRQAAALLHGLIQTLRRC